MGCVIIRQTVVDAALDYVNSANKPLTQSGEVPADFRCLTGAVRLFAPAMLGFDPTNLPGFVYNLATEIPRLGRFLRPLLQSNPVHEDLQPEALRLREIRRRTESLAETYPWMQSLRGHLLFGRDDHTVFMDRYDCDPIFETVENQDHRSICKPTPQYLRPLEFVSYGLSKQASV